MDTSDAHDTISYTYRLIGGARDGEEETYEGDHHGIIDNFTFAHPAISTLCEHYRLESIYADDDGHLESIDYVFVREFNRADWEEYIEHNVKSIEDWDFDD